MGDVFVCLRRVRGRFPISGRVVMFGWVSLVVEMGKVRFVGAVCLRVDGPSRYRMGCGSVVAC